MGAVKGWFLSGSNPNNYEIGVENKLEPKGNVVAFLKSNNNWFNDEDSFGTMMQQFSAKKYRGDYKRFELSCLIKTDNLKKSAGLWMQIHSETGQLIQSDNTVNRHTYNNREWNHHTIVIDIPKNSEVISFGVILHQTGQVWIKNVSLTEVGYKKELTNLKSNVIDSPVNLKFI
mgnify:CR=1 FL=1